LAVARIDAIVVPGASRGWRSARRCRLKAVDARPEAAIEVAHPTDRADDLVDGDLALTVREPG
jgi:hypothetical protein